MRDIRTNRDLYSAIAALIEAHTSGDRGLEEYLRALWQAARGFRTRPALSADEFFGLLSEAFTRPAPAFDEAWRSRSVAGNPEALDFDGWEALILRQVVDLRELAEQGGLADEWRYFGIKSPRGAHWVNFDPLTFLECAAAGSFGGWEPGDPTGRDFVPGPVACLGEDGELTACDPQDVPRVVGTIPNVTWKDFGSFLECGQWYE